jgi:hypothetical protein
MRNCVYLIQIKDEAETRHKLFARPRLSRRCVMNKLGLIGLTLAGALLCTAAPVSLHWSPAKTPSLTLDTANARIGRPLTPMSVAGVNRRMHRRAYYGAAAVAGAAAAGTYYARRCGYYPYPPCY